jgi:hypothetical protein
MIRIATETKEHALAENMPIRRFNSELFVEGVCPYSGGVNHEPGACGKLSAKNSILEVETPLSFVRVKVSSTKSAIVQRRISRIARPKNPLKNKSRIGVGEMRFLILEAVSIHRFEKARLAKFLQYFWTCPAASAE